jgi:hypothetical membrane protein
VAVAQAPERRWLLLGVLGPALFVASFLVQGAFRPGYDPLRHPVSSLALGGSVGLVQSATFVLTGVLFVGYAAALRRAGCGWATPILVGVVGLGLIGAGIFAADPINGYPPGSPVPAPRTPLGVLHDLCSTPVFLALPVACLVMARRLGRWGARRWRAYSIITALLYWALFVLAALGFNRAVESFVPIGGLWQRLCLIVGFGWLAALALWLRRHPRRGLAAEG